jgi:uncharacterized membrane protein YkvA (DUF1232 family)
MKFFTELKTFITSVASDERIPARDKKILLTMVALLVSPLDLIPDWIPILGLLDDLIILAFILDYFFTVLDSNVLLSHYPWDMKSFARLRAIARGFNFLVPRFIKKRLWQYVGDPY